MPFYAIVFLFGALATAVGVWALIHVFVLLLPYLLVLVVAWFLLRKGIKALINMQPRSRPEDQPDVMPRGAPRFSQAPTPRTSATTPKSVLTTDK